MLDIKFIRQNKEEVKEAAKNKNIEIDIEYNEPQTSSFTADEYDLLIITHSKFVDDLQPLVVHL